MLTLNQLEAQLVPSQAHVGRLDIAVRRTLSSHPRAWLQEYWEVLEGVPGAIARDQVVDTVPRNDQPCPVELKVAKDGVSTWRIEGGAFSNLTDAQLEQPGRAFGWVELLCRSRAELARLAVHLGPVKSTPFASITNLTTGQERPYPFTREGDLVTVTHSNCPARTLLRLYWPLER